MTVKRTVGRSGGSLIIAIPADIAKLHDIEEGTGMECLPTAAVESGFGKRMVKELHVEAE